MFLSLRHQHLCGDISETEQERNHLSPLSRLWSFKWRYRRWAQLTLKGQTEINYFWFGAFWPFRATGGHRRCHQSIFFAWGFLLNVKKKHTLNRGKFRVYRGPWRDSVFCGDASTAARGVLDFASVAGGATHTGDFSLLQRQRNHVSPAYYFTFVACLLVLANIVVSKLSLRPISSARLSIPCCCCALRRSYLPAASIFDFNTVRIT